MVLNRQRFGVSDDLARHPLAHVRQRPRAAPHSVALSVCEQATRNSRRANSAHIGQSRPDSGFGLEAKVLDRFQVVPSSPGIGTMVAEAIRVLELGLMIHRRRANMAHTRQSGTYSGPGFQVKVLKLLSVVVSWIASG